MRLGHAQLFPGIGEEALPVVRLQGVNLVHHHQDRPTAVEAPPTAAVEASPTPAAATAGEGPDRKTVLDNLLASIAEKTGYELEDIEPDMELEADLGVPSR